MVIFNDLFDESIPKIIWSLIRSYGLSLATYAVEIWQQTAMFLHLLASWSPCMAPIALILMFKSTRRLKSTEAALLMTTSTSSVSCSYTSGSMPRLSSHYSYENGSSYDVSFNWDDFLFNILLIVRDSFPAPVKSFRVEDIFPNSFERRYIFL